MSQLSGQPRLCSPCVLQYSVLVETNFHRCLSYVANRVYGSHAFNGTFANRRSTVLWTRHIDLCVYCRLAQLLFRHVRQLRAWRGSILKNCWFWEITSSKTVCPPLQTRCACFVKWNNCGLGESRSIKKYGFWKSRCFKSMTVDLQIPCKIVTVILPRMCFTMFEASSK